MSLGDAYERLVDRLLDSPRFGEHQARYWLDAVRYGDTHGLHLDNRRGIYPYRDWVVRAFNENLPLDDFITWQVAGDLLPDASLEQKVATGFVRMNPSTGEGGALAEEFQMKNNFDRVETLGTVFLGMSLTCARCHTHKYDPIEQSEYYRLMAFFNSTAERHWTAIRTHTVPSLRCLLTKILGSAGAFFGLPEKNASQRSNHASATSPPRWNMPSREPVVQQGLADGRYPRPGRIIH